MIILINNIKRLLKTKSLLFLFLLPIIFTALFVTGTGSSTQKVAVVNNDSYLSNWIVEGSAPEDDINLIKTSEDFDQLILKKSYDLIVVFPKNYEEEILKGKDPKVDVYYSKGNPISILPMQTVVKKADYALQLGRVSGSLDELKMSIKIFEEGVFVKKEDTLEGNNKSGSSVAAIAIGMLLMSLMFVSNSSGAKMNDDKKNGMYQRIIASSISRRRYSLESMLTLFVIVSLKIVGVMLIIMFVLGGSFGENPMNVLIALLAFGLVAVSITNLINAISKDRKQAMTISVLITTPVCMLGGCFWPIEITPKVMQYFSNFVPTTWAVRAINKMMLGLSLYDIRIELAILLLFALAMFILGSSKKIINVK